MSKNLPCLSVRRPIHGGNFEFELWQLYTNEWEEFDVHWFPERRELPSHYYNFEIDSFCIMEHKYVVETSFSKQFCLDLESPTSKGWQLHEGGMFRANQTYVVDNGLHLDAYGGYYMKVDDDCAHMLGPETFLPENILKLVIASTFQFQFLMDHNLASPFLVISIQSAQMNNANTAFWADIWIITLI